MITFRGKQFNICTLDFETHYAQDYSLTGMATSAYVRDKRFLVQMVGVKINDEPTKVYTDKAHILMVLKGLDWKNTLLLCHNTAFDGFILTQKYKVKPAAYLDTLSMARAVLGHAVSHRLDNVGICLGLGGKQGADSLKDAKGLRVLPPELLERMGTYCTRDVDLCYDIFWKMYDHFPDNELDLVDLTIKMFTEPKFQIDTALVQEELDEEIAGKVRAVIQTGLTKKELGNAVKFAEALGRAGAALPMKKSPTTGKMIPAVAKTDAGMRVLLAHPQEAVRNLAKARLTVKSTIGETRAQRFLDTATGKTMPVLLNYYGAHTGRWSGGNKMNLQNLPRPIYLADGTTDPATGRLRRALRAPKGKMIVVADSSQIEPRVNAWLAGQHDVLEAFRAYDAGTGPDLYRIMATKLFGVPLDQVTKQQRFYGKVCVLLLGYGGGPPKLYDTITNQGETVTLEDCIEWVHIYRDANNMIKRSWKRYQVMLPRMALAGCNIPLGPCTVMHEAIRLPSGLFLRYPDLKITAGDWDGGIGEASYQGRNSRTKLYGASMCENLVQALSRCIIAEQMLTLANKGMRILSTTHDEIIVLSSAKAAERTFKTMVKVMSTPPSWAPDLPLAAAGGWAENYSK